MPAALLAAAVLALVFRTHAPEGQVVARVGGSEVTLQDVLAEARANERPAGEPLTPDLVEAVIDRSLLAQEAHRRGVERGPTFPSDQRRAMFQFLASELLRKMPVPPPPTSEALEGYIAAHPDRFGERRRLILDEIRYAVVNAPDLQGLHFDEARRRLEAAQARHEAHQVTTIAADLPAPLQHALSVADPDTVVVWRDGPLFTAFHVAAAEDAPLSGEAAQFSALETLNQISRAKQIASLVGELKVRAGVRIQPGFAP